MSTAMLPIITIIVFIYIFFSRDDVFQTSISCARFHVQFSYATKDYATQMPVEMRCLLEEIGISFHFSVTSCCLTVCSSLLLFLS